MNFYEAYLDIEGHESQLLVPNIDMPGDESVYVLGLRPSSTGVEVLISDSEYVRDIDLRVSPQCHITTLRPNNSFKPKPLRGSA